MVEIEGIDSGTLQALLDELYHALVKAVSGALIFIDTSCPLAASILISL